MSLSSPNQKTLPMKIAVIDTSDSLSSHLKNMGYNEDDIENLTVESTTALHKVAKNASVLEDIDAYLINLEGEFEGASRSECKGADLIFWLRLKHNIGKPIIITAFQGLLQILKKKPTYTILNAEGIYFVDILSDFSVLDKIDKLKKPNLSTEQIRHYYLEHANNVLNLASLRHQEANWWGIKSLWDTHRLKSLNTFKQEYPEFIEYKLNSINNLLSQYYFKTIEPSLQEIIQERKDYLLKEKKVAEDRFKSNLKFNPEHYKTLKNYLLDCAEKIHLYSLQRSAITESILISQKNNNIDTLQALNAELKLYDELINLYDKEIEAIKSRINEYKIPESEIEDSIDPFEEILKNENIIEVKNDLNRDFAFLQIDDLAHKGWNTIFNSMFSERIKFDFIDFSGFKERQTQDDNIQILEELISEKLKTKNYSGFLLDLRLFPEDEQSNKTKNFTGFILMERLRKKYPEIPIIITSASNKIWTYKDSVKMGAHAYWIKEGIDNFYEKYDAYYNYDQFKKIIYTLVTPEYYSLQILSNLVQKINKENSPPFWWENKFWSEGTHQNITLRNLNYQISNKTEIKKEDLSEILNKIINFYSNFLRLKNITSEINEEDATSYYATLIVKIGKLVEMFHPTGINRYISTYSITTLRGDELGTRILDKRNKAAHNSQINFDDLKQVIIYLKKYLIQEKLKFNNETHSFYLKNSK